MFCTSLSVNYFNSHPHEEDDGIADFVKGVINISTHILTKRMTMANQGLVDAGKISTHILTKRMTVTHGK